MNQEHFSSTRSSSKRKRFLQFCIVVIFFSINPSVADAKLTDEYAVLANCITTPLHRSGSSPLYSTDYNDQYRKTVDALVLLESNTISDEELNLIRHEALVLMNEGRLTLLQIGNINGTKPTGVDYLKRISPTIRKGEESSISEDFDALSVLWEGLKAQSDLEDLKKRYRTVQNGLRSLSWELWNTARSQTASKNPPAYYGIGVRLALDNGQLVVKEVLSKDSVLIPNDTISLINGRPINNSSITTAIQNLSGDSGTVVKLSVQRASSRNLEFDIHRTYRIEPPVLALDLDDSWNGNYKADQLWFTNTSGRTLKNCTLRVTLHQDDNTRRIHLHYLEEWKAGDSFYALYGRGSEYTPYSTLDRIQQITVALRSSDFHQDIDYAHTQSKRDEDIARACKNLDFDATIHDPYEGFWGSKPRRVDFSFKGLRHLDVSKAFVTLQRGNQSVTLFWDSVGRWDSEGSYFKNEKTFGDERFRFKPDKIILRLNFENSNHEHIETWSSN